jgi:hypothetical protein
MPSPNSHRNPVPPRPQAVNLECAANLIRHTRRRMGDDERRGWPFWWALEMKALPAVSVYTVQREMCHSTDTMLQKVYAHLGTIRHRSAVVEYRVEQHHGATGRAAHRPPSRPGHHLGFRCGL